MLSKLVELVRGLGGAAELVPCDQAHAAGRDSGQLASYAIEDDGALTPIGITPAAPQPVWVEAVALAR